jgi:hypothetical protein
MARDVGVEDLGHLGERGDAGMVKGVDPPEDVLSCPVSHEPSPHAGVLVAGAGIGSLLSGGDATPSATAVNQIPPAMLALYQGAAATCPGLPWTVLAAIGTVESHNGQSNLPGVHSGLNFAGLAAISGCGITASGT